uniref:Uncharacterized protein n=1 Tax=Steinernema glaseri TaxID=37863 RepID=A0A1I7YR10_9BILA
MLTIHLDFHISESEENHALLVKPTPQPLDPNEQCMIRVGKGQIGVRSGPLRTTWAQDQNTVDTSTRWFPEALWIDRYEPEQSVCGHVRQEKAKIVKRTEGGHELGRTETLIKNETNVLLEQFSRRTTLTLGLNVQGILDPNQNNERPNKRKIKIKLNAKSLEPKDEDKAEAYTKRKSEAAKRLIYGRITRR